MRIESGPTTERIVRTSLFFLLCAVFCGLFLRDGMVGYRSKNIREHLEQLPADARPKAKDAPLYPAVTEESLPQAKKAIGKIGRDRQRAALAALYGGPPSHETDQSWYYFGPAYRVIIHVESGSARKVIGQKSSKSLQDIRLQLWFGGILGGISLVVLVMIIRIVRTRVVLDEAGLEYRGRKRIRWDQMQSLVDHQFRKKGRLELIYIDEGRERSLRLDEYHLAKFADVVAAICARKHIPDPVAREKDEKARAGA